jgi:hypothetical protein
LSARGTVLAASLQNSPPSFSPQWLPLQVHPRRKRQQENRGDPEGRITHASFLCHGCHFNTECQLQRCGIRFVVSYQRSLLSASQLIALAPAKQSTDNGALHDCNSNSLAQHVSPGQLPQKPFLHSFPSDCFRVARLPLQSSPDTNLLQSDFRPRIAL